MSREVMQQALEALEKTTTYTSSAYRSASMTDECSAAIAAGRAALAEPTCKEHLHVEPVQEPVADRAAFERHAERLGYSVDPDTREGREGGYWSSHTQLMWLTWQAALAEPVQEPRTIRMERVDRSTSQHWWSEAARIRMPSPELYAAGDTVLCWVNEGDMVRAAQPKAEPVQEPVLTVDALRVEFERRYRGNLGITRVEGGAYLSPAIETEWQQFVRKYTTPPQRKPVEWDGRCMLGHCNSPAGCENSGECRAVERAHGIGGEG